MGAQIKFCRDVKSTELPAAHKQLQGVGGTNKPEGMEKSQDDAKLKPIFHAFFALGSSPACPTTPLAPVRALHVAESGRAVRNQPLFPLLTIIT